MTLKQRIVHESLRLFSLKGFVCTTIDDILYASGASKGGLYNHFKCKDDLFYAVLEEARRIWQTSVLDDLDEVSSPLGKVRRLLHNYQHRYLKDVENIPGGCIFITLAVELDDQRPEFAADIQAGFENLKLMLKELLQEAIEMGELKPHADAASLSEMIFVCMVGASVLYGMDKHDSSLRRSFEPFENHLEQLAA